MSEQQEIIAELGSAGVLGGIRWAYLSAAARSLEIYAEDGAFDDAGWLGTTRYTLFKDRLDRVFACGRYVSVSGDNQDDLDLLFAQLSDKDIRTMPRLDPTVVERKNLNGSPGWVHGGNRFLLASSAFGKLDELPWPQKSPTKQRVASQRDPDPDQPSLFEGAADEELSVLEAAMAAESDLDMTTFVVAHSLDALNGRSELVFGRPMLNVGGGKAWRWREDLLNIPPIGGGFQTDDRPRPIGPDGTPDAPVRLRPSAESRPSRNSGGER
ncbi:hypothetical protein H0264_35755 [Nocardia huaxiensis]|uniref:Uncharacterized protein n=1 Tax=Nocardia huaxiensis TaxID=2755382 RepID=A0A7D6ZIA7_9NOCA|nr:hypothetical protein [Nocardia huaxiensis]QLY30420.1 hypothetical protein H0264_35755 [Nocardia huaxiensis]